MRAHGLLLLLTSRAARAAQFLMVLPHGNGSWALQLNVSAVCDSFKSVRETAAAAAA
jgi:hypothetical protein